MPVPSKPQGVRARRNRASTRTVLSGVDPKTASVPDLPASRSWHARTIEHWEAVWLSPMAPEFDLAADYRGLVLLAEIWDAFYDLDTDPELNAEKRARLKKDLAGEIRLQEQRFGLSPLDRRRLQWEIDRGDEAEAKTRERRNRAVAKAVEAKGEDDPRALLSG